MHGTAHRLGIILAALISTVPLPALFIEGGVTTVVNERFASGFPSSPVANTSSSFLGAGLDFSGIGWLTGNSQFSLTLISPQHFLITTHTAPAAGTSVSFLSQAGVVRSYTVDSTYTVTHAAGVNTDITIGRLTAPIAGADQISSVPILSLGSFGDYLNLPLLVYGQNGRVGQNTLDSFFLADMLPFGGGNGVIDSVLFRTDLDPISGQSQGEGGDSGSPTLYVAGSNLTLLGIHSAIDTAPTLDLTYDSFIPSYAAQINSRLALDGYALQAIPEPSTVALTTVLLVFGFVLHQRRRTVPRTNPAALDRPAAILPLAIPASRDR